jgi:hypothetical protein
VLPDKEPVRLLPVSLAGKLGKLSLLLDLMDREIPWDSRPTGALSLMEGPDILPLEERAGVKTLST